MFGDFRVITAVSTACVRVCARVSQAACSRPSGGVLPAVPTSSGGQLSVAAPGVV